ncbi:hypothetical protein S40293_06496 [Stachybotrys chartarum IBT 40293]|nr:hypothetical protein S40293_06496 [Stachybotrys chartarum IBT 40293]
MHVFILGATGRNGLLILQEALSRNHTVTALVRTPSVLPSHPSLTTIQGSPTSQCDIQRALATKPGPPSAIISALANRRNIDAQAPADFLEQSTTALLAAVANANIPKPPKLVINSTQGVKESFASLSWLFRIIFRNTGMHFLISDHERVDALVRTSQLPFVLARPGLLLGGPSKPLNAFSDDGKGAPWTATATRQSIAKWMVDACETTEWDGRAPVLSN